MRKYLFSKYHTKQNKAEKSYGKKQKIPLTALEQKEQR